MNSVVTTNFKPPRSPHKKREPKARDRREGMDPKHVANVAKLRSCISGKTPCEPHHLRVAQERGVGLKATDRWCVPLTREEHNEVHRLGSRKEEQWFVKRGVACYALAYALWANKRPSPLALQPGLWMKMIDDSEAAFKKRLAEANTPTR